MRQVNSLKTFQNLPLEERVRTYLAIEALKQIKISDNNEPLVDLAKTFAEHKMPLIIDLCLPEIKTAKVRKKVALLLLEAAASLAPKFHLKIVDAFRPLSIQRRLFEEIRSQILKNHPELKSNLAKLYAETTKFIMDPKANPPHATGGAVDLTLVTGDRKELDMGNAINSVSPKSHTFCSSLPPQAKKNRELLFGAMTKQGFANLPTEWWHYSFGDQYWAAFYGKETTLYGEIEEDLG